MMTPHLAVGYWKIAWFTFLCDRLSTTKKKLHAERERTGARCNCYCFSQPKPM